MQSSLILKQRPQIHLNSQIFFIISVTVLKMDKQSDFISVSSHGILQVSQNW